MIENIEKAHLKKNVPQFKIGDTVRIHLKIVEGNKERIQIFTGTVIARKGKGLSETFSVYRHAYGSSMERVFLLHSPRIQNIEVTRPGRVRRAKLYYLRGAKGKAARVPELLTARGKKTKVTEKEESTSAEPEEKKAEKEVSDANQKEKKSEIEDSVKEEKPKEGDL